MALPVKQVNWTYSLNNRISYTSLVQVARETMFLIKNTLKTAGYTSGMLGKYHLGGGEANTPPGYGFEAPHSTLGLDFYEGYWDLPPSVDMTLGGQAPDGTYDCGTIGGINVRGAACFPDGSCVENVHPLQAMAMGATPLLKADGTLAATCAEGS